MSSNYHQLSFISISTLLLLLSTTLSAERCHPDDKKAINGIKKAFKNAVWASTDDPDCCNLFIAICDPVTNRVNSLYINNDDNIAGPIPDSIGDLPYLVTLQMYNLPNLTGQIPQSLSKLINLDLLWISHTQISGKIPNFLSRFDKLTSLDLSHNKLSGPILPSLSSLPILELLILEANKLTGSIPKSFGGIKQPMRLQLGQNKLSGPLQKSLGAANFETIDISSNKFRGDASMLFVNNQSYSMLNISWNRFSFDISDLRMPKELTVVDLSHNMIYGTLLPAVAELRGLQVFDVNHNKLHGSLPSVFAKNENLFVLNVSYNRFCGKIPTGGVLDKFDESAYAHNKCLCGSPLPPCQ